MRHTTLWKEVGETPLQAIQKWRTATPKYRDATACYAGRLDPMAEGKLLVLLGEECKRQKEYHGLDKEYEVEVLLDIGSDTGDVLGIVGYAGHETRIDSKMLRLALRKEEGTHVRPYPAFSSKTVDGKPLFLSALEGTLQEEKLPTHKEHIYRISLLGTEKVSADGLRTQVEGLLAKAPASDDPSKALGADFRIKEVRESWRRIFEGAGARTFVVVRIRVASASGAYMRSLAGRVGQSLGTKALALSIRRTRIGRRLLGVWVKEF